MLRTLISTSTRGCCSLKGPSVRVLPVQQAGRFRHLVMAPAILTGPGSEKLRTFDCSTLGACSRETPLVLEDQMRDLLAAVPSWRRSADGIKLTKSFTAKNFMAAIKFFNKLAEVAEADGHHPDIHLLNYRDVSVDMTTHAAGGLTMLDFVMAAKIDTIDIDFSPKWLKTAQEGIAAAGAASPATGGATPP